MTVRNKLLALIGLEVVIIFIHKILDRESQSVEMAVAEWHFILALAFGIFVVFYAFNIKCKRCGARQVLRGGSAFDLRLPEDECYNCGNSLNKN